MFRIPAEFHGHTIFFGRVFKDNVFNHVFMWAPVTSQVTHLQYLRYGDIVIFVKFKLQQLLNEEEFQHNFFLKLVIFYGTIRLRNFQNYRALPLTRKCNSYKRPTIYWILCSIKYNIFSLCKLIHFATNSEKQLKQNKEIVIKILFSANKSVIVTKGQRDIGYFALYNTIVVALYKLVR